MTIVATSLEFSYKQFEDYQGCDSECYSNYSKEEETFPEANIETE